MQNVNLKLRTYKMNIPLTVRNLAGHLTCIFITTLYNKAPVLFCVLLPAESVSESDIFCNWQSVSQSVSPSLQWAPDDQNL